ncbi:MAG TPA: methyltransferase domain-containing protein [Mycobacteriales bacterium]|nr:methyltransferase domain-containing protein [Mycobacteriales bacterium]
MDRGNRALGPGEDWRAVVEAGYDAIAETYLDWAGRIDGAPRLRFLGELDGRLTAGSRVLDLGCGAGVPCTRILADRHHVLGVDMSARQLELAREHVPAATFQRAEMTTLDFPAGSWDAVTAFYSLTHLPRAEQAALITRIARWLRPGGLLLATFSVAGGQDSVQPDFLGTPMVFGGPPAEVTRTMLTEAGFDLLVGEPVTQYEPGEGEATFLWVLGRTAT